LRFGADYGARNAVDCKAINGGKNADLALPTAVFSRRGILFYSPQANYTSPVHISIFPPQSGGAFFAVASYGARTAVDCRAINGGKNADLALPTAVFSRRGILFSSSAERLR